MDSPITCNECEAITRELAEAYVEMWDAADPETKRAWTAVYKMVGGTEEDVQKAEELIKQAPREKAYGPPSIQQLRKWLDTPLVRAQQKKWTHESRSGHKVPFRQPF